VQTNPARCQHVVNAAVLATDIANGTLPDYGFYVPDVTNDGHDTGIAFAE
jgi:acid phosphatase